MQPDFSLDSYLGTWYELYRSSDLPFYSGDCVTAHYARKQDDLISVENTQQVKGEDGRYKDRERKEPGEATHSDDIKDAHLKVRMSDSKPWRPYNVLASDYDSYAVVAGCQYVWVLTRQPLNFISENHQAEIARVTQLAKAAFTASNMTIDFAKMRETVQNDACSYFTYN